MCDGSTLMKSRLHNLVVDDSCFLRRDRTIVAPELPCQRFSKGLSQRFIHEVSQRITKDLFLFVNLRVASWKELYSRLSAIIGSTRAALRAGSGAADGSARYFGSTRSHTSSMVSPLLSVPL
jgi:hypothetical protein